MLVRAIQRHLPFVSAKIATPRNKAIARTKPPQNGSVTNHHDQAITSVNFKTTKTIPSSPKIPICMPQPSYIDCWMRWPGAVDPDSYTAFALFTASEKPSHPTRQCPARSPWSEGSKRASGWPLRERQNTVFLNTPLRLFRASLNSGIVKSWDSSRRAKGVVSLQLSAGQLLDLHLAKQRDLIGPA